jgi:hypothetical protein
MNKSRQQALAVLERRGTTALNPDLLQDLLHQLADLVGMDGTAVKMYSKLLNGIIYMKPPK